MASLQELRKRLRSIRATGQMAGAMRTAATAKYARAGRLRAAFAPYAQACRDMAAQLGSAGVQRADGSGGDRTCLLILGGNRGMCGGFNAELSRFIEAQLPLYDDPLLLVCGRRPASFLRERGIGFEEFTVSDVPAFGEIRPVTERILSLYGAGEVGRVTALYQSFQNMLVQTPAARDLLPENSADGERDGRQPLYLPDRATIGQKLAVSCFEALVYDLIMENAAGAQAATLMAMRSACDNAEAAAAELEITINRRRQADVTSSVIETASGNVQQGV